MANIQIQNLPSTASPINGNAYAIIKDGLEDKKVTVNQLRQIDVSAFTNMASTPVASDLVMIGRGSNTFKTLFQNVGFPSGTKMWFYENNPPMGWSIVPGMGDCLLAIAGGDTYNTPGQGIKGDWQQQNHILTPSQIPPHTHNIRYAQSGGVTPQRNSFPREINTVSSFPNFVISEENTPSGEGHNHGSAWRPASAVGILGSKD